MATRNKKKNIWVTISKEGNRYFAESKKLALYGVGSTPTKALLDFAKHIKHFTDYYKRVPRSELVGEGLRMKDLYENFLARV